MGVVSIAKHRDHLSARYRDVYWLQLDEELVELAVGSGIGRHVVISRRAWLRAGTLCTQARSANARSDART